MKSVGPIIDVYAAARGEIRRKVEKPNASNTMYDERETARGTKPVNGTFAQKQAASRTETTAPQNALVNSVPSSFIAQVLGQILTTKKSDAAAATRAYESVEQGEPEKRFIRWA
jgi:hypothetical protein